MDLTKQLFNCSNRFVKYENYHICDFYCYRSLAIIIESVTHL